MERHEPAVIDAGNTLETGPLLGLLACPVCQSAVESSPGAVTCVACGRHFRRLGGAGAPVMLPDEALDYEPSSRGREVKAHVRERFAEIDREIPRPFGAFATFLNLGYVPDGTPDAAVRGPARPVFNACSTRLLFEVLADCDLDGRVVVELGCGRGGNVAMIGRYYAPAAVVGVDLSSAHIDFCQTQHAVERGGFVVGDVEYLPIRTATADVVLNLESSHYYPNISRFYEEVCRALRPGGDFLYADILPAEQFDAALDRLASFGLEVTRDRDITANVLLSCEAIARRREAVRHTGLYESFLVVPGSPEFEALRSRRMRYKILAFRKP